MLRRVVPTLAAASRMMSGRASTTLLAPPACVPCASYATSVEKFTGAQPVQSKRPAHFPGEASHTEKWLQAEGAKSPMEYIAEVPPIPIKLSSHVPSPKGYACPSCGTGGHPGLDAPKTYYNLNSTTPENPVKCKYCGLRMYGVLED